MIQAPDGAAENQRSNHSFAPPGLKFTLPTKPTANAVGYYLSLLRSLPRHSSAHCTCPSDADFGRRCAELPPAPNLTQSRQDPKAQRFPSVASLHLRALALNSLPFPSAAGQLPVPLANEGTAPAGTSQRDGPYRSAGGAAESSPRCQSWVNRPQKIQAPDGAAENQRVDASFATSGAKSILPDNTHD